MKVSIIGTGYVGITTGACLAYLGHQVTCIDSDEKKIAILRSGKTPIYEPFLEELLADARQNLRFCTQYAGAVQDADVIFIAVGTPPSADGSPDLRYLSQAARGIGEHYNGDFTVVVNKSTVPIGSGNWVGSLVRESYEQHHGKKNLHERNNSHHRSFPFFRSTHEDHPDHRMPDEPQQRAAFLSFPDASENKFH